MFFRLLLLLTLLPLVELVLLAWLSAHTDWRLTVLFVLGTGALGAWLIRSQGWRAWRRIRQDMAEGKVPAELIQDGLLILVAGLLLITPGVLTDVVGVLLLGAAVAADRRQVAATAVARNVPGAYVPHRRRMAA